MAATVGALQHRDSNSGKSKPGRRKILLIEDDTALQQYVETILDRSKFAITANWLKKASGQRGIDALEKLEEE